METKIYERLISLGYAIEHEVGEGGTIYRPTPTDLMLITFISDKVTNNIKSECNIDVIPTEIENLVIDNIVGEFLLNKKSLGTLVIDDIDLSDAVKSITEGDTTIQFAEGSSQSEQLDTFISYLIRPIDLSDYRRIRW